MSPVMSVVRRSISASDVQQAAPAGAAADGLSVFA